MAVFEFPRLLLRERSHSWNLVGVAATPGATGRSVAPIIRSDGGGFWTCSMLDVSLSGGGGLTGRDRQRVSTLLWRAVRQNARGGAAPIIVPCNDAGFRPWPAGLAQTAGVDIPHDDGTVFDDGVGYYQATIDIRAAAAAELRDTSLDVVISYAGALLGGERFSIEHDDGPRLYEIATVFYSDATHATITFQPPLRSDVAAGAVLEFDRPRCLMRLATPSAMDLSEVPWTFNAASVEFVETFV